MELKVGNKFRGHEIVFVSDDKRVIGISTPDNLGRKGVVYGKCHFQKLSEDDLEGLRNAKFEPTKIADVWYIVLDSCVDYPQIFSRCNHWTTDPSSAYSVPAPMIYEN